MPAALSDPDNRYQRRSPRTGVYLTDQERLEERPLKVRRFQSTTATEERDPSKRADDRDRPKTRIGPVLVRGIFEQRISALVRRNRAGIAGSPRLNGGERTLSSASVDALNTISTTSTIGRSHST
jgi:hypothetical protein